MAGRMPERAIDLSQLRVRPAAGLERRAAMMLLPDRVRQRLWNDYWLAALENPLRVLAAAASFRTLASDGRDQLQFELHVAAPYRGQGIARAVIERLDEQARQQRAVSLLTAVDALATADAGAFLQHLGFELVDRRSTFEADTERLAEFVLPRRDWLVSRGEVPAGTRVVSLREADVDAVTRLHVDHLGGTLESIGRWLRDLRAGPMADDNCVLLVEDQIAGLLLGSTHEGLTRIEASIVSPVFRGQWSGGGWANLMMMAERLEWAIRRGSQRCRFSSLEAASPTRKLAAQAGAERVAVAEVYRRRLVF